MESYSFKDTIFYFDQGFEYVGSDKSNPRLLLMAFKRSDRSTTLHELFLGQPLYMRMMNEQGELVLHVQSGGPAPPGEWEEGHKGSYSVKEFSDQNATTLVGVQALSSGSGEYQIQRMTLSGLGVMVIEATDPIEMVLYQFRPDQWVKLNMVNHGSREVADKISIEVTWQPVATF